jgi:hypothetical protein
MSKAFRLVIVALLTLGSVSLADLARAQNEQTGDNESNVEQSGAANSGDAVGGQVVGVVSAGDASVDATNHSEDVDIETGDATASNTVFNFTGQFAEDTTVIDDGDIDDISVNAQEGDNSSDVVQAADATSGDGVGGQVIGVVTSVGGSADVVAANTSEDIDVETGDADADNFLTGFVGQLAADSTFIADAGFLAAAAIDGISVNGQDGDNASDVSQDATATSGDGVGGQVLGIVSAGDASVDATNNSEDVDIETGDAFAENFVDTFVGQLADDTTFIAEAGFLALAVITDVSVNGQEGDNASDVAQAADASTGDGVGGQVIGAVTSAGGSADVVAANTSEDVDIETGDAFAGNEAFAFVGQLAVDTTLIADAGALAIAAIDGVSVNGIEGDNESDISQAANASTGDGVGGQVLGIVSAGDASVDATNNSEDVDIETGDAFAENFVDTFVGQFAVDTTLIADAGFLAIAVIDDVAINEQDGDIASDVVQTANAASGDAVAGQVAGVVTSAGGSADLVLANTSEDIDAESGFSDFVNDVEEFVGQQVEGEED